MKPFMEPRSAEGLCSTSMDGKVAVIAGGSAGLGRELASQLVQAGADVIILARNRERLEATEQELVALQVRKNQKICGRSVDLTDYSQIEAFAQSLDVSPGYVFCVAGGCAEEVGFFADISSRDIVSCFEKNYFSSAFVAHAFIRQWINQPKRSEPRHLIFTGSTAAFIAIPGYAAYTPTKTALRALADTLRQEVLMYESHVNIQVHCSFPGTIFTETFEKEQQKKPDLCKEIEGSDDEKNGMTSYAVAKDKAVAKQYARAKSSRVLRMGLALVHSGIGRMADFPSYLRQKNKDIWKRKGAEISRVGILITVESMAYPSRPDPARG
uniref:3-ketodihydrosphingosine reductase TSC10 n=1 Tax=Coccidioides posadasii RMSCC 3488 TaxID=454284 RepID=A0A0J6F7M6_COCPO|nr:3-ketodihydrosphingosine reductase TSC10 [Coccidioides posadasii RMSCC 3488]